MFSPFERMVAMRYLRPRRKEGFVSLIAAFSFLGIALGVATLIIVMSVMNGFRHELMTRILGLNGHIGVFAQHGALENYDLLAGKIKNIEGIASVSPMIEGQVMIMAKGRASGGLVRGLKPADLVAHGLVARNIKEGTLESFGGEDSIVLGERLAQKLGVVPGDKVTLISPLTSVTAFGSVPRMRAYTLSATFNVGMYEYDSTFIFLPLDSAQLFFRLGDSVSGLEIMTANPDHLDRLRIDLQGVIGPDHRLVDWRDANASFFNAIQVERNVMFLILTLIIVVAAFNIISSLIMLVKDKGRAIAILRTMGATRGSIMRIFFIAGSTIGVAGTLAGFALGVSFSANIESIRRLLESFSGRDLFAAEIYFLSKLPAIIDPMQVLLVVSMGLGLTFLATLYPSWRAARLDPVEALRYE